MGHAETDVRILEIVALHSSIYVPSCTHSHITLLCLHINDAQIEDDYNYLTPFC